MPGSIFETEGKTYRFVILETVTVYRNSFLVGVQYDGTLHLSRR